MNHNICETKNKGLANHLLFEPEYIKISTKYNAAEMPNLDSITIGYMDRRLSVISTKINNTSTGL